MKEPVTQLSRFIGARLKIENVQICKQKGKL